MLQNRFSTNSQAPFKRSFPLGSPLGRARRKPFAYLSIVVIGPLLLPLPLTLLAKRNNINHLALLATCLVAPQKKKKQQSLGGRGLTELRPWIVKFMLLNLLISFNLRQRERASFKHADITATARQNKHRRTHKYTQTHIDTHTDTHGQSKHTRTYTSKYTQLVKHCRNNLKHQFVSLCVVVCPLPRCKTSINTVSKLFT